MPHVPTALGGAIDALATNHRRRAGDPDFGAVQIDVLPPQVEQFAVPGTSAWCLCGASPGWTSYDAPIRSMTSGYPHDPLPGPSAPGTTHRARSLYHPMHHAPPVESGPPLYDLGGYRVKATNRLVAAEFGRKAWPSNCVTGDGPQRSIMHPA